MANFFYSGLAKYGKVGSFFETETLGRRRKSGEMRDRRLDPHGAGEARDSTDRLTEELRIGTPYPPNHRPLFDFEARARQRGNLP